MENCCCVCGKIKRNLGTDIAPAEGNNCCDPVTCVGFRLSELPKNWARYINWGGFHYWLPSWLDEFYKEDHYEVRTKTYRYEDPDIEGTIKEKRLSSEIKAINEVLEMEALRIKGEYPYRINQYIINMREFQNRARLRKENKNKLK